jgi:uncharacterized protein
LTVGSSIPRANAATACVWKVTAPNGVLYLGGSFHALRGSDYPLPPAFNRAFDASTRLAFEADPKVLQGSGKNFLKAGEYPESDSLKNHVDPRTYDYLRRVFAIWKVPEEKIARLRPWFIAMILQTPELHGYSSGLGVEGFLTRRARANSKPVSGLESLREGIEIFSGLSDRESEAFLLLTFIPAEHGSADSTRVMEAWRHGDADTIARMWHDSNRDVPALGERMVAARNRNWIPKIDHYLRSGQTYFVVVGAAHIGGPEGLLALLKTRGYQIEQL